MHTDIGLQPVPLHRSGPLLAGPVRMLVLLSMLLVLGMLLRFAVFLAVAGEGAGFLESFCLHDCQWYRTIIEGGYDAAVGLHDQPGRANWAFFPLYPLLVGMLVAVSGWPVLLAGHLVSTVAVLLAAATARPLFGDRSRAYWLFAVGLLAGPFAFLFSTLYSEALFILLTVLVLVALQRGAYLTAAGFGALLSATRPTGVLVVFAILVQMLVDHRSEGRSWRSFPRRLLGDGQLLLPLLLAPLGLFAYMAFLHFHTGDALAFAHIQRGWGRGLGSPIETLAEIFGSGLSVDYHVLLRWSWAVAAVIGLALTMLLAMRGQSAAALFCLLCLLISLSSGVGSMVRFVAGLAPLGMIAADLLARWRPLAYASAAAALAAGMLLTAGWLNGSMFVM